MSIDARRRYAAAAFVVLLTLSVFWPSPIVSSNRLWLQRDLSVDELSFLGREAASWDVVFWCLAGLFTLLIVHGGQPVRADAVSLLRSVRSLRPRAPRALLVATVASIVLVAIVWIAADLPMLAFAEWIQGDWTESFVRILNRLGGGMNPPMIILFFLIAGLAYRAPRWVSYGLAMAAGGLAAGLIAQLLKFAIGRTRPELWLGPFHYARGGAVSFPSGHTVGAFALAGVLLFASRNVPLRVMAMLIAFAIAFSRVLAFRHWASDVVASAIIGTMCAWVAVNSVTRVTSDGKNDL